MSKEIFAAAKLYAANNLPINSVNQYMAGENGFIAGAKWAEKKLLKKTHWVSVKERLPEFYKKVFVKIRIKGDEDFEDCYDYSVAKIIDSKKLQWDVYFGNNKITHWKEIE
ncbi:MAG: DUF551 domain-containing protein [Prevotellaceae bacterium]|jgi:hypothetical protein|nr:DUF551 domain-containing protein [Prevotellaceae bacterium]